MGSRHLFLLVYVLGSCWGISSLQGHSNEACMTQDSCNWVPDSTSHFLQCVGLPSTDTGRDHMRRLKGIIEASMDVYSFMTSSMARVPLMSLEGELKLYPGVDAFQNETLVQMWLEIKIKPLLRSISKQFLTCLSIKNFSCSTYHTVVKELSYHFSEMDPVRQKWIYTFFMYPFLSSGRVAGCMSPGQSSEEWLQKNFGAFKVMARMKDISTLNITFHALEVLHLLTQEQKAELLLRPEVAGLNNDTLNLVFHSLTGGKDPQPTIRPAEIQNLSSTGYSLGYTPILTYYPYPPPTPEDTLKETAAELMGAFRPIGSLIHGFVSFTRQRNLSEIRSTTLTQFLLNWTLAEMANMYREQDPPVAPERPKFDVTDVEDWYQQVVVPLLLRFLPKEEVLMHENIKLAFNRLFFLDSFGDKSHI
ncbi:uncharacterized protein mslnb [Thalassophryne amazonica]|uniref:uncharacterized protein mslnb n=1 Tax=Thalassophryne amazonica TaxID=390379 RepID=UPI0014724C5E|nr:uncharacterized protein mslnb [Thalassophryne amazonica]XP_034044641.1 uncharacterized protein mslnb [Thalassophryne amazonica]XP_034044642.1 uncharacterized protein mslnb [Thalassophryne amazonica]